MFCREAENFFVGPSQFDTLFSLLLSFDPFDSLKTLTDVALTS